MKFSEILKASRKYFFILIPLSFSVLLIDKRGLDYFFKASNRPTYLITTPYITKSRPFRLSSIPIKAEIIYHYQKQFYVMDRNGNNVTQISFRPRDYEHVAVSRGRRYIAANDHVRAGFNTVSRLWIYDVLLQTEAQLIPDFYSAGEGGVSWGPDGYIYFAAAATPEAKLCAFKIKYDGTGLQQITSVNAADLGVSQDGRLVAFRTVVKGGLTGTKDPYHTEIWEVNSDGTNPRSVYTQGGKERISSVHDPEISPDNQKVIFSKVNSAVPANFCPDPCTAHDLYLIDTKNASVKRLTITGAINIIPNWQYNGDLVVATQMSESSGYLGAIIINTKGAADQIPLRIKLGASQAKFMPS